LPLPDRDDDEFWMTPARKNRRTAEQAEAEWEKACRQRWRALVLILKAKLEAVESEIADFETEFLGHIVLPNGQTVGDHMVPQVEQAYATGAMPAPLAALGPGAP